MEDPVLTRTHLWLGQRLRSRIRQLKVTVMGCGGLGVRFIIEASHLGIPHFVICDPDDLDETNLNRYVIATRSSIGMKKVDVVQDYLNTLFPNITVLSRYQRFPSDILVHDIGNSDYVVACFDDLHARLQLDILCRRMNVTLVDLGTGFARAEDDNRILSSGGQVIVSRPRGPCLMCAGFDLTSRPNDYFVPESDLVEPSFLTINSMIAALGLEVLFRELAGELPPTNRIEYRRDDLKILHLAKSHRAGCSICGNDRGTPDLNFLEVKELRKKLSGLGIKMAES